MKFSSPDTTSPLKPLTVDVFGNRPIFPRPGGGDSGYNSTPGNNGDINHGAVEARLAPHSSTVPGTILHFRKIPQSS